MRIYQNPTREEWNQLFARPSTEPGELDRTVDEIFTAVRTQGDSALRHYTQLFDGVDLGELSVSETEMAAADALADELKNAIDVAYDNIEAFHLAQRTEPVHVETAPGIHCWQEKRPIERVGLYIPGGSAPLFSSVLMLAIPARIAGCSKVVLVTPPNGQGEIDPAILYTARKCGVDEIYKVGGIQAIAGLVFGTESIPVVDKLFGPGNQYVTAAKQWATRFGLAIDMPAGPSELLVFADKSGQADFIASDLLSQAEHGPDSQVIFITTSSALAQQVAQEIEQQMSVLPRAEIAARAMEHSRTIVVGEEKEALQMINAYGPEHLIIISERESYFLQGLQHAGSVFLGPWSPESAGDYATGTNHTLPTNGYARQFSGVNLDSFTKSITFQKLDEAGIRYIGPSVELMAAAEGLQAHKQAVTLRLSQLNASK